MHNALPLVFSDLPTTHPPDTYLIGSSIFTAEKVIIGSDPTARSQQRLGSASFPSLDGMAPTTAINRATPATTNAVQLKILPIRAFPLIRSQCALRKPTGPTLPLKL